MNGREVLRQRLGELAAAFALLTRLPVGWASLPEPQRPSDAVWAYPVVGAALGLIGGIVYWLLDGRSVPPLLAALWALAAIMLATGAMHEDGLADAADALAGNSPQQRLDIMRDSRTGAFGVLAVVLSVAIRAGALMALAQAGAVTVALVTALAASRASLPALMAVLPNARAEGLSFAMGRPSARLAAGSAGIAALIAILLVPLSAVFWIALLVGLATLGVGLMAHRLIGGQTGDVLGANCQLTECLALTALAAVAVQ